MRSTCVTTLYRPTSPSPAQLCVPTGHRTFTDQCCHREQLRSANETMPHPHPRAMFSHDFRLNLALSLHDTHVDINYTAGLSSHIRNIQEF